MREFKIPQDVLFHMIRWTIECPDIEVCGVLIGRRGVIEHAVSMGNHAEFPDLEFAFDPLQQIEVWETAHKANLDVMGVYHSHVKREAYPSPADVHYAAYPGFRYVILNQNSIRAFTIVESDVVEEKIVLDY